MIFLCLLSYEQQYCILTAGQNSLYFAMIFEAWLDTLYILQFLYKFNDHMKSPTSTILHSIQVLKTKLRSDHLQLQGIKRDFAMGPSRPIIQIQQRSQSPLFMNNKPNTSLEKHARQKLLQLRKNHQSQMKKMRDQHIQEQQSIKSQYQARIQELTSIYESKINEQQSYIDLLEEQIERQKFQYLQQQERLVEQQNNATKYKKISHCFKIYQVNCSEMTFENKVKFKVFEPQKQQNNYQSFQQQNTSKPNIKNDEVKCCQRFQQIINNLLKQNASLLQDVERLKMQNRKLVHSNIESKHQQRSKKIEEIIKNASIPDYNSYETLNISNLSNIPKDAHFFEQKQYCTVMPVLIESTSHNNSSLYRSGCQSKRNRLKFSKASEDRSSRNITDRSFMSVNKQNIDTSNIRFRNALSIQKQSNREFQQQCSIVEEEQEQIMSQQMKLRTIKHFMKAISHRSTQQEEKNQFNMLPKYQSKKGNGIRNALKSISAL